MDIFLYFQAMWQLALDGDTQGIWFYAALYTLLVCNYSVVFQVLTQWWPFAEGELVQLEAKQLGAKEWAKSNQEYSASALYHYTVEGIEYQGRRVSPWIFVTSHNARAVLVKQMSYVQKLANTNNKVKVFYNPRNPQKSFLIIAGKTGIAITLLISWTPFILYYFKYYN